MENELYYNGAKSNRDIELYKLTGDKKMKYLDDFITEYEWSVEEDEEHEGKYIIYDLQSGDIEEENYTLEQVIDRVVGRALDYEIDEHGDDFYENFDLYYNHKSYIDYINGLYDIAKRYVRNEDEWLLKIGKDVREMTRYFEDVNK